MWTPPLFSCRLALVAGLLASSSAHAGRPLTVDDANTDDAGTGHVEGWYARLPGHAHTWTVAPAYAPVDGLELGASVTRDRTAANTSQALRAKWRITPSQEAGCHTAAVLGATQTRRQGGTTPYLNSLLSCNSAWVQHTSISGDSGRRADRGWRPGGWPMNVSLAWPPCMRRLSASSWPSPPSRSAHAAT